MMETYYRLLKHDPEGKLVKDSGLIPSHSYVIQFLELIEAFFDSKDKSATDVDSAESVLMDISDGLGSKGLVSAGVGDDTYGIVVGTNDGATSEDNENYALDTKIASGAGAGQLTYQAVTFVAPRIVGTNIDFDVSRTFLNETAGNITIKEIGLICKNTTDTKYHLLLRDVVADEVVGDGLTLTVVYVLRTTV
ncbi:MAG TPA: hypothetical protein VMW50_10745 [Dehalococcoidia bacterium]|nr:hypothetical protein [Dehalococcoidia bacterium]